MGRSHHRVYQVIAHQAEVHQHQRQVADDAAAARAVSAGPATITLAFAARVASMTAAEIIPLYGEGGADGPVSGHPLPPLVDVGGEPGWTGWEAVATVKTWANDRRQARKMRGRR